MGPVYAATDASTDPESQLVGPTSLSKSRPAHPITQTSA